jgi:hypothetical protein
MVRVSVGELPVPQQRGKGALPNRAEGCFLFARGGPRGENRPSETVWKITGGVLISCV